MAPIRGFDAPSPSSLDRPRLEQLDDLTSRFLVQLQRGCGVETCPSPLCATARSRSLPHSVRTLSELSARAMAVILASYEDADAHLCPFIPRQTVPFAAKSQPRIDSKSIIQQLYNTKPLRKSFTTDVSVAKENVVLQDGTDSKQASSDGSISPMTNRELMNLAHSLSQPDLNDSVRRDAHHRLASVLSDFTCLSQSFSDNPLRVMTNPLSNHPAHSVYSDWALSSWTDHHKGNNPSIIFDNIWKALGPIFESPFAPRSQWPTTFLTLPPVSKSTEVHTVVYHAIHALTSSVPRTDRQDWQVVSSVVINGKAYGKQQRLKDGTTAPSWLDVLDAFEYEPALRMAKRLIRAIGARTCLEEALDADGDGKAENESVLRNWKIPVHLKLKRAILNMLVQEERKVRLIRFGDVIRDDIRHGKMLPRTTSLVWLEWLRKCFLKEWDGSYRVNRWNVAGSALELIEALWICRGRAHLDIAEAIFATPVVFSSLDIDKAAQDWLSFNQNPNTRHLLSYSFLFSMRAMSLFVRAAHHISMRKAYEDVEAVWQMRRRAMPQMSYEEASYLDRRLKTAQDHYLVLKINRHSILSDAFDQLWHREKRELLRPLRVRMGIEEGEIGHDLGGVQIEFFKLACQEAFRAEYSLFTIDPQTRLAWFQPATMLPLYKYQLFGVLFGLAVYNGITLPVSFPLAFYRKLLFQKCEDSDLAEGWPDLAKSLKYLRDYEGSVEDDLAREYVYSFSANGLHLDVNMDDPWDGWSIWNKNHMGKGIRPGRMRVMRAYPDKHHPQLSRTHNESSSLEKVAQHTTNAPSSGLLELDETKFSWPGWAVEMAGPDETPEPVTNDNREKYIHDYSQWVMDWSIRPQFLCFLKGFYSVLTYRVMALLTAEQLRTLVEGHNHLDIDALQRATTYSHYTVSSPVIRWFWEVVKAYPQKKQQQLLEFVTASSRVPVNGAESLTFVIERSDAETSALPGSSTCFGTLRLPEYESKKVLEEKLGIALEHSLGFGQA